MLHHPKIRLELGVSYEQVREKIAAKVVFYSGPIDEYFGYRYGKLPYRSLRFEHEHLPGTDKFQPVGTVNYPNEEKFTRITEFKHMTGQMHSGTSILREYPSDEGEPYYPVLRPESEDLLKRYLALAAIESNTLFVGRLAEYRYYNMDQVVAKALMVFNRRFPVLAQERHVCPNQREVQ